MTLLTTLRNRWKAESPKIFKWILRVSLAVNCIAFAIQTALVTQQAELPQWWITAYPYLIGVGAGAAAVAKLTKKQGGNTDSELN